MRDVAVLTRIFLTAIALSTSPAITFAQEDGDITDRIPLAESQLEDPGEGAVYADLPASASGAINVSAQPSEIDKRLPEPAPRHEGDNALKMPSPPPLREQPSGLFVLTGVEITGVTAFAPEIFAPLYDDKLARAVSLKDVAEVVDAITDVYRKNGYFLSRATAPAQSAEGGVLRIHVAEGYLDSVAVKGDSAPPIKRRLRHLTEERPLRLATLERALAQIGDLKGVSVTSTQIEPDPVDFARHRLIVTVKQDAFEASLYTDNRGIAAAGPVQAYARLAANSIFRTGDQISLGVFTIPDDPGELALAELAYQTPILDSGAYARVSGLASKFDDEASLATLGTQIETKRLSFSLSYPVIRSRKTSLWANAGFDARNIEEQQLGAPVFEDKLRVLSVWTNYRSNHWNGHTTFFGKISRGLDMLGATIDETSLSRPDANGQFTKFEAQISRYQNIGKVFGLYASLAGQASLDPLLASEEFSLGGARFGRAYDYGELTGDDGAAALVEFRYGRDPNIGVLDFYQLYGFVDYGVVWNDNAAPGFDELSLSSAGVGLRLTFPGALSASLEAAKPLDYTPALEGDRDWRGFFSISKSF